jgi:hypothetical protein
MRVLFIGNSYTYEHGLPALVSRMAAAGGISIETAQVTYGGWTLQRHRRCRETREAIARAGWEWVVLQEHSRRPFEDRERFFRDTRALHQLVEATGARTCLYLTWARLAEPERQPDLTAAYLTVAGELGITVAPVGLAWERVRRERPDLALHIDDGSHPTPLGTYLAALVFTATLTGSLSETVHAEIETFSVTPCASTQVVRIDPVLLPFLRQAALESVRSLPSSIPASLDAIATPDAE